LIPSSSYPKAQPQAYSYNGGSKPGRRTVSALAYLELNIVLLLTQNQHFYCTSHLRLHKFI